MASLEIHDLAGLVTGRLGDARMRAQGIRCEDGGIAALDATGEADVVIDAAGAPAAPGPIDSHVHGPATAGAGTERDALDRIVLAADTPTGTGIMPSGMLETVAEMSAPGRLPATDALAAIELGDIPAISAVIIDGELRAPRSRNTPAAVHPSRVSSRAPGTGSGLR